MNDYPQITEVRKSDHMLTFLSRFQNQIRRILIFQWNETTRDTIIFSPKPITQREDVKEDSRTIRSLSHTLSVYHKTQRNCFVTSFSYWGYETGIPWSQLPCYNSYQLSEKNWEFTRNVYRRSGRFPEIVDYYGNFGCGRGRGGEKNISPCSNRTFKRLIKITQARSWSNIENYDLWHVEIVFPRPK